MKFIEGQIIARFGQLLRAHAEVVSGAYKLRQIEQGEPDTGGGCESSRWRELSDDEKLRAMIGQMNQHNHLLSELCEALPTEEER